MTTQLQSLLTEAGLQLVGRFHMADLPGDDWQKFTQQEQKVKRRPLAGGRAIGELVMNQIGSS